MILMSPPLRPGKTEEERAEFLRKVKTMNVKTVSFAAPADWTDREVEETRRFLDEHGIRSGEFSGFYKGVTRGGGLGAYDKEDHRGAIAHYARQMRHAKILGSHCVGFSTYVGRGSEQMWSAETWARTVGAIEELAKAAEKAGVVVAGHPHVMSPLNSVERYRELLDAVDSPNLKILMDPVNLTWPQLVYETTDLVNKIFDELGDSIVALHAKDVILTGRGKDIAHVDEAVPGTGAMDYATILRRLDALDRDVTLHVEHFPFPETVQGQQYIRHLARESGISLN